jgi:hypothetical protein
MQDGTSGAYPVFNMATMITRQQLRKRGNEGAKATEHGVVTSATTTLAQWITLP